MGDTASYDTLLDAVVFLIPIAVLMTLVVLFLRRRRTPPGAPTKRSTVALVQAVATPVSLAAPPADVVAEPSRPARIESVDEIGKKIEIAIANGEKTSLSNLYLDLSRAHEQLGNIDARMSALRSAAGYGALHGPPSAHAAARLALGEAAHLAGDLTSACEQWQMARTAFLDGGDTEQHDRIEKRMRENGCPTDWVLTDF
jgi:hypothetical protein